MFGLGFGELVVIIIVGVVVVGPRDLPRLLRTLGQWAGKLRRMAADLRVQSGIDDVLREGDLRRDIEEIRKLARGELDHLRRDIEVRHNENVLTAGLAPAALASGPLGAGINGSDVTVEREREYPAGGADTSGALPDTAVVYGGSFPESKWAKDPLYTTGEEA